MYRCNLTQNDYFYHSHSLLKQNKFTPATYDIRRLRYIKKKYLNKNFVG